MIKIFLISTVLGLVLSKPGELLTSISYGNGGDSGGHSFGGFGGGHSLPLDTGSAASYSGGDSYSALSHGGGGGGGGGGQSDGGDYHHGVSIVGGGGGGGHTQSFDLTNHGAGGGHEHTGLFGGTFISSGKYEGGHGGNSGGGGGGGEGLGGHSYGVVEQAHYSDVLGASEGEAITIDGGHGGGGGGGGSSHGGWDGHY